MLRLVWFVAARCVALRCVCVLFCLCCVGVVFVVGCCACFVLVRCLCCCGVLFVLLVRVLVALFYFVVMFRFCVGRFDAVWLGVVCVGLVCCVSVLRCLLVVCVGVCVCLCCVVVCCYVVLCACVV